MQPLCFGLWAIDRNQVWGDRWGRNSLSRSGIWGLGRVSGCLEGLKDYRLVKGFHTIILENVRTDHSSSDFGLSNPGPLCHIICLTVFRRESFYLGTSEEKESSDSSVLISPYMQTELTEKPGLHSSWMRTRRCAHAETGGQFTSTRNERLKCCP